MKMNLINAAMIFAVLAASTGVYLQMGPDQGGGQWGNGPRQPMTADQRLQHMTQELNLSDAHQEQIKPILESEAVQIQALRAESSLSPQERMSKMTLIRQPTSERTKPILNADQRSEERRVGKECRSRL